MVSRRRKIGLAYVVYNRRNPNGLILTALRIKPPYQRQRYGRLLLQQVIDEFSTPEWHEMRLIVQPFGDKALDQEQLIHFYQRFGFVRLPTRGKHPLMRRLLFSE
jgi:ribosomal protein S18 acetylase RimI-like enzyme